MKKLNLKDKLKLIKATILSGTIALSVSGCGITEEQQQKNPKSNGHQIVQEIDTVEPTTEEQVEIKYKKKIIEGLIKKAGKAASTKIETQQPETQQDTEEPIEQDPEQKETQQPEQHTQQPTQKETQQDPEQHTQQPETHQQETQQPEQHTQTEQPTQKPTQQYIDYSSIDYKLTDISNNDIYYASYAYSQYANSLDKELFGNYSHQTQYGISKSVVSPYIFLMLNYNQDINKEMFEETASEEEFKKYCDNMNLADYQCFYETNVDFRKYVLDEDFANFLNTISAEYKKYKNGEDSQIENYIDEYFKQNDTNYVRKYFMANTRAMLNRTSGDYFETLDPEIRQEYYDNVVKPLYNEITNTQTKTR